MTRIPLRMAIVALASLVFCKPVVAAGVCGDVNDSGHVNTSDALLVLKTAVGQNVGLVCSSGPLGTSYGYTTDFITSGVYTQNYLLGIAIDIAEESTVTHFGIISAGPGPNVRFALYSDGGGKPGTLVIGSSPAFLQGGMQEVEVPATKVQAGTYWVMALYDSTALIGSDQAEDEKVYYRALNFGDPYPAAFGAGLSYEGSRSNYWVKVQLAP